MRAAPEGRRLTGNSTDAPDALRVSGRTWPEAAAQGSPEVRTQDDTATRLSSGQALRIIGAHESVRSIHEWRPLFDAVSDELTGLVADAQESHAVAGRSVRVRRAIDEGHHTAQRHAPCAAAAHA